MAFGNPCLEWLVFRIQNKKQWNGNSLKQQVWCLCCVGSFQRISGWWYWKRTEFHDQDAPWILLVSDCCWDYYMHGVWTSGALWRHDRTAVKEKIVDFLSSTILSGRGSLINSYLRKASRYSWTPVKMLLPTGYFLCSSWNKWLFGAYLKLKNCRLIRYFLSHGKVGFLYFTHPDLYQNRGNWSGWPLIQNTVIYQDFMGLHDFFLIYIISFNMIFCDI